MLVIMIKEFLAICEYLKKSGGREARGYLIIERPELEALLNKNRYLTSLEKLKYWKALHWIDADENQTTKKVCVGGVRKRCIKLELKVYGAMKDVIGRS